MILVDTSIWVDHLRRGNQRLVALLEEGQVLTHPFVVGELACGSLRNRAEVLTLLQTLPEAKVAEHREVMEFVERSQLFGHGVGWIDAHLLASALLSGTALWTADQQLARVASVLKIPADIA